MPTQSYSVAARKRVFESLVTNSGEAACFARVLAFVKSFCPEKNRINEMLWTKDHLMVGDKQSFGF